MKKIIILLFVVFSGGCSLFPEYFWECPEEITSISKALRFMYNEIGYKPDGINIQKPDETYRKKSGDCDDMSGLLSNIFIYTLHLTDVKLIGCIVKETGKAHMIVRADGVYYESTTGQTINHYNSKYITVSTLSYNDFIDMAMIF